MTRHYDAMCRHLKHDGDGEQVKHFNRVPFIPLTKGCCLVENVKKSLIIGATTVTVSRPMFANGGAR